MEVDPVPWARAQMAFTLAFHIILVPLGVSWSVMALIANYRGIRQRRRRRHAARAALVEVHGGDLRGRCGDGNGSLVRVRPAVAAVHGAMGRGVRRAVRVRGSVLLRRGRLHLDLHLRLAAAQAVATLLDRRADRRRRHLRQRLGGGRQRVDELTRGCDAGHRRQRRGRRPGRRHLQRRDAADGGAHGDRGLRGRRLSGGLGLRDGDAAGTTGPLPPTWLSHRLHGGGHRHPGADGGRRRPGSLGL